MKKKILSILLVLLCFVSCKYDLLPEPSNTGNSGSSNVFNKKITAPINLQASQGDYRSVTLTWDPVLNATQYQIYSADTEFDKFEKKGETKGTETSFTLPETTGVTKAYYVKAVDYYGNVSRASQIVIGSTISVPIITDITKNKDGDIYTINWWMSNCSETTYEDLITYTIFCYEDGVSNPVKIDLPGTENSYQFTNLKESTTYKFTIEAFKTDTKNKHEISDVEPIETGHRIVPLPASDFTVSKGTSTSTLKISFKLPPKIEVYNKTAAVYEKDNPIYFTLKRKLSTDPDTAYETVYAYIGSKTNSESIYANTAPAAKKFKFDSYVADKTIELTDTISEANRGKKYDYILQSYTDYNGSNTTSDKTAVAAAIGWTISPASFKTSDEIYFDPNNPSKISTINVSLQAYFNTLDLPYTYVLTSHKYDINNNATPVEDESVIMSCDSITELNNYTINFTDTENQEGYYEYKLYIIEQTDTVSAVPSEYLDCISAPSKVTVIADATALPEITYNGQQNFHVEDGYKDHYIISWDSLGDDCSYVLSWVNKIGETYTDSKSTVSFTENSYTDAEDPTTTISKAKGKVILKHSAKSGEIRSYTLTATKGLSKSCTNQNDFYTLGTAEPEMKIPDYKTITVSWAPVQKAKTDINEAYVLSAKYKGDSTELLKADKSNYTISEVDGRIVCVLSKPEGYADATKSGKPIEFKVTSKSEVDQTTGSEDVYTLGPANLNVHADTDIYTDHINVFWNKVEGASGYLVYRTVMDMSNNFAGSGDILYVESNNVYDISLTKLNSSTITNHGEMICLSDFYEYCEVDESDSVKLNQRKISWGIPFGYTVLPVLKSTDINYDVEANKIVSKVTCSDKENFNYANVPITTSATFGYGLNVTASKAISSNVVTISWDQPYIPEKKIPKIYRRIDNKSNWEMIAAPTPSSSKNTSHTISYAENDTTSYEYAVVYNNSTLDKSYVNELQIKYDPQSPAELLNKGYTMSIPNGHITAAHNSGYKEMFDWTDSTYDFSTRNIGPDYYEIQILNNNNKNGWTTVAIIPINKDNNYSCSNAAENIEFQNDTKVKLVSSNTYQAIFEPIFDEDNISMGQMKVLHDYKHYYRLVAVKMIDDKRENAIISIADIHNTPDGRKINPFACREITNKEFIKLGMLIYTDVIYEVCEGGIWQNAPGNGYSLNNTIHTKRSGGSVTYTITDYSKNGVYPVSLSSSQSSIYAKSMIIDEKNYTREIKSVTLTYTVPDTSELPAATRSSYSGSITLSTNKDSQSATIKCSKLTEDIKTTNQQNRIKWLPLRMNTSNVIENADPYWWHNSENGVQYGW